MWRTPTAAEALAMKFDLEAKYQQATNLMADRRKLYETTGYGEISTLRSLREEMEAIVRRMSALQSQIRNMDRVVGNQIASKRLIGLEQEPGWLDWMMKLF